MFAIVCLSSSPVPVINDHDQRCLAPAWRKHTAAYARRRHVLDQTLNTTEVASPLLASLVGLSKSRGVRAGERIQDRSQANGSRRQSFAPLWRWSLVAHLSSVRGRVIAWPCQLKRGKRSDDRETGRGEAKHVYIMWRWLGLIKQILSRPAQDMLY